MIRPIIILLGKWCHSIKHFAELRPTSRQKNSWHGYGNEEITLLSLYKTRHKAIQALAGISLSALYAFALYTVSHKKDQHRQ